MHVRAHKYVKQARKKNKKNFEAGEHEQLLWEESNFLLGRINTTSLCVELLFSSPRSLVSNAGKMFLLFARFFSKQGREGTHAHSLQ